MLIKAFDNRRLNLPKISWNYQHYEHVENNHKKMSITLTWYQSSEIPVTKLDSGIGTIQNMQTTTNLEQLVS